MAKPRNAENFVMVLMVLLLAVESVYAPAVYTLKRRMTKHLEISDLQEHDRRRHAPSNGYFTLSGNANPYTGGMYFIEMGIGNPVKIYRVDMDTGSDLFWLNCSPCLNCQENNSLWGDDYLYDPSLSSTSYTLTCSDPFCDVATEYGGAMCQYDDLCHYSMQYGDGGKTSGYIVRDNIQYIEATGDSITQPTTASIALGCGVEQSSEYQIRYKERSGILGLGHTEISLISQLASLKNIPRVFAHCLDGDVGGTLVIGHIVDESIKVTPLLLNMAHYSVKLKSVEINGATLLVDKSVYKNTIIDSGTTLAFISDEYFEHLVTTIMSAQPSIMYNMQEGYCFMFNGSVDQNFPFVTFNFEGSTSMTIYPHDYLILRPDNAWCIGWRSTGSILYEDKSTTILGDLVLKNKIFVYNLEERTIGWTEYDCSTSMQLKNDRNEAASVYQLIAGKLSLLFVSHFTLLLLHSMS